MKPKALVGIAGGTCSGKTMVANRTAEMVGKDKVLICSQDNYYHDLREIPAEKRAKWDFDRPEAFDNELLIEHLEQLMDGSPIEEPVYSFIDHTRTGETTTLDPRSVIIIEGIQVLFVPELRDMLDFSVYVDESADLRLARRLQRDEIERGRSSQSVILQYMESVRPAHLQFVEPSKRYADIIIPRGGKNTPAIRILSNHIRTLLNEEST